MQSATNALLTGLDTKIEIDTDIESILTCSSIKHEKQNCSDTPIILNNFFKIEKDEPEMHVEETACYMNTMQLSKELNIKNEICADPGPSHPGHDRIKTEPDTGEWNESALSMSNMMIKADPDASTLHTEFDMKNEDWK
nr:unnamed protein product [Callosobruchus analis]